MSFPLAIFPEFFCLSFWTTFNGYVTPGPLVLSLLFSLFLLTRCGGYYVTNTLDLPFHRVRADPHCIRDTSREKIGFVHIARDTMCGKGWVTNDTKLQEKVMKLYRQKRKVATRYEIAEIREGVLRGSAKTFADCGVIYVSGDQYVHVVDALGELLDPCPLVVRARIESR